MTHRFALAACLLAMFTAGAAAPAAARGGPIHGLVTMGDLRFDLNASLTPQNRLSEANTHPGIYAAAVLLATWDQLEPQRGRFDFSVLDHAIANLRSYNAAHPATPMVGKLRIFSGLHAPDWVLHLDGGPVTLVRGTRSAAFPHFWSVPYRKAWRELQTALAAHYDNNPLIAEVAVSSCSSVSAEPFAVPLSPANRGPLAAAGYTTASMQACLMGAIDDYAVWRHTAIDYTFNPMRILVSEAPPGTGAAFTIKVMRRFRATYGARAVIANHGLQPQTIPQAIPIYSEFKQLGPPLEFQTLRPHEDWDAVFAKARAYGVTELEIWNTRADGGMANVNRAQLRAWHQQMGS